MTAFTPILIGHYDYRLVALSVVIAICAAYAALDLAGRVTAARGSFRVFWLAGGATAMGLGIWCMHYVGMLAYTLEVSVQYDWPLVLASLVAAILASTAALFVVSRRTMGPWRAVLGSVAMGSGIASMHYIGMAAMRLRAMCQWNVTLVTLSVALAIIISYVALQLVYSARDSGATTSLRKVTSAIIMGAAIPVMHYTGMAAASYTASDLAPDLSHAVGVSSLGAVGISTVTLMILGIAVLTSVHEKSHQLEISEKRYRSLFEDSPAGVFSSTLDGRILDCNLAFCRILGYGSREELLAGQVSDLYENPGNRAVFLEQLQREGRLNDLEHCLRRKDGSPVWVLENAALIERDGGEAGVIEGALIDISKRRRAEEEVRNLAAIVQSSDDAIIGVSLDGVIQTWNRSAETLFGYRAGEVMGKSISIMVPPERSEEIGMIREYVKQGREVTQLETVRLRNDGWRLQVSVSASPIRDSSGNIAGISAICRDISDRKRAESALRESEAKHRHLFENAIFGIYLSKQDGTLLDVNPALVAMLGYGSKEELLARNLGRDIYEDPAVRQSILDRYGAGDHLETGEANWKRKDGKIINVRISAQAARARNRAILYFEGIVEDVTERRSLEEQFRQAQKMDAVGRLAGGVAHDFNNLLMIINTYSQMLGEGLKHDEQMRRMADQVLSAGRKAASLTRQLLTFSRKQVILPMVLDLNSVLADMGKMLPRLIGEDIDLQMLPGEKLGKVKADASQLQQVVLNLAVNSRDAMPDGGRIVIETANVNLENSEASGQGGIPPGPYVLLRVSDTGTGMDDATQARMFEPFFTTKPVDKGTGLGLSIVFGIVKQSGGYIFVDSQLGHGSTFKIYLPRVDQAAAPSDFAPAALRGGTETILLVEDAEGVRVAVGDFLEGIGYRVLYAMNPAEALVLLHQQNQPVHLLLTDVVMPGMNGRELANQAKAECPDMRVLYMSGYTDRGSADLEPADFGPDFLEKPFALDQLARRLREYSSARQIE